MKLRTARRTQRFPRLLTRAPFAAILVAGLIAATPEPPPLAAVPEPPLLVVANQGAGTISVVALADAAGPANASVPIPAAAAPHEVAVSPNGSRAVVTEYGDRTTVGHSLKLLDLRGGTPKSIELGTYARPHGAAWTDAHHVAVTSEASQTVILVDVDAAHVDAAIPTGGRGSHMLVLSPDHTRAYVVNVGDGSLSVVDLRARTRLATVRTGNGAEGVGISPDGREVWVANRADENVSVFDTASGAVVATLPAPGLPYRVAFAPDGATAYVSCVLADRLRAYDVRARRERDGIELPRPTGLTIASDGATAYVAHGEGAEIRIVDLRARRVVRSVPVGAMPDGVAVVMPASPQSAAPTRR